MIRRLGAVLALGWGLALAASPPAQTQQMTQEQEEAVVRSFRITMQARSLFAKGNYAEAEALFRQSLEINAAIEDNALSVATDLHNIAAAVAEQGRLPEAETLAREALGLRVRNGAVDNALVSSQQLLATILADLNRFTEARGLQEEVVQLTLSGDGVDDKDLVRNVVALAWFTASDGYVGNGIAILNQLTGMLDQMPPHDVARVMNALGRLSSMNGQPDMAERYYRQAVALSAQIEPTPDWSVKDQAGILGNLASILNGQGRHPEALALFRQADAILTEAGSLRNETRATILDGLGESLRGLHDLDAAWQVQREALDLRLALLPEGHVKTGISFSNLGLTLLQAGQVDAAIQALEKAVAIQHGTGDALRLANAAGNLAGAYAARGETMAALDMGGVALAAVERGLPPGHPRAVQAAFNQAWLHLAAGQTAEAAALADPALARFVDTIWRLDGDEAPAGVRDTRRQVLAVVVATWETEGAAGMNKAFRAAQWAQASKAAHVARRVSARFAAGEGALAALVRRHQDRVNQWAALDRQYLALLGQTGADDPRLVQLRGQMAESEAALSQSRAAIAEAFPGYARLTQPNVVGVAQVQAVLRPGEALVMPVTTPDETYVFAISADGADWARSDLTEGDLDAAVRALRATLDPNGPVRSAAPLAPSGFAKPALAPFDAAAAHRLYQGLIAPVAPVLEGRTTLHLVKEGALSGLPLAVLLRDPVALDRADATAFASAPWLIRDFALSTAPSAAAFVAQRSVPPARAPSAALAGFADPDFSGAEGTPRPDLASLITRTGADARGVRSLPRLPGTRRELMSLARALNVDPAGLNFGTAATEAAVKSSEDLRAARIAVFATHGLVAGELNGLTEPALAFSAPQEPGPQDDGLLTASEAAQLDLAADWVILSACNTAAADGTPGGAGLSGLASAFLYAGARSLLVSHWPVRDDAAEVLTGGVIEARDRGKAAALQAAMLSLLDTGRIPGHAHPSVWAPFVVVSGD